jgi:hypothetical protein
MTVFQNVRPGFTLTPNAKTLDLGVPGSFSLLEPLDYVEADLLLDGQLALLRMAAATT